MGASITESIMSRRKSEYYRDEHRRSWVTVESLGYLTRAKRHVIQYSAVNSSTWPDRGRRRAIHNAATRMYTYVRMAAPQRRESATAVVRHIYTIQQLLIAHSITWPSTGPVAADAGRQLVTFVHSYNMRAGVPRFSWNNSSIDLYAFWCLEVNWLKPRLRNAPEVRNALELGGIHNMQHSRRRQLVLTHIIISLLVLPFSILSSSSSAFRLLLNQSTSLIFRYHRCKPWSSFSRFPHRRPVLATNID